MKQKYVLELKMLAIISVTNLNDLQTHIFWYLAYLLAILKSTGLDGLVSGRIAIRIDRGLGHLATLAIHPTMILQLSL
jgi:hypothetical protein